MAEPAPEIARRALASLEHAVARKPERDGEAFSAATEQLCRLRDSLGSDTARRDRVNAVISAVLAGHFPLGKTPWPVVERAADELRSLFAD